VSVQLEIFQENAVGMAPKGKKNIEIVNKPTYHTNKVKVNLKPTI